jgi:pantoate--beta-alanine ligase
MEILRDSKSMRAWSESMRANGARVGLVPTMGYLHDGHMSLVRIAKEKGCGAVAASIFVNPTQFGPGEDFERYPRDEARDLAMLEREGVAAVFMPGVKDIYPDGYQTFVEVTGASQGLCGAMRPGHFRGVATVVAKLLIVARPHLAVFGQKDFQQLAVIRRMACDLGLDVEIEGAPIVRETDGLAMSSRNKYLEGEDRIAALCLYKGLCAARDLYAGGVRDPEKLAAAAKAMILAEPRARFEYAEARDPETLSPARNPSDRMTILVAARVGPARLIDNIAIGGSAT